MCEIKIRLAAPDDAEDILNIYKYYVLNTAVSFEYIVPEIEEFKNRIRNILKKYPYFVALINDKIIGYAYAHAFGEREAYKYSAELSIYIDKNYKRLGIGRLLYNALEEKLKTFGITNLYALIVSKDKEDEYLTFDSLKFHKSLGFKQVGKCSLCGYKFDRWYDVIYTEKFIRL